YFRDAVFRSLRFLHDSRETGEGSCSSARGCMISRNESNKRIKLIETTEGRNEMQEEQSGRERRGGGLYPLLIGVVVILVIAGAFTLFQRKSQYAALANETEKMAIPTVAIVHPLVEAPQEDLVLPGTLQAYVESPIYARSTGYLKKW